MTRLPKVLEREPLVDAVFEVRMGGEPHLADLLPGVLFGLLEFKPDIRRLPAAEIPLPVRLQDPNLAFAPVIRLDWSGFTISLGDRSLVIGCKMPYPKWPKFKDFILKVIDKVSSAGITGSVDRYSLKYVNLIQAPTIEDQISKINLAVKVGDVEAEDDNLNVQVHKRENDILHIMSVISGASTKLYNEKEVYGIVVDIDSIRSIQFANFAMFSKELNPAIESLRLANKAKFFGCLTESTIKEMRPEYD